jgi:predicted phosphodiesterase
LKKVIVVGDLHAPWHCIKTVSAIYSAIQREKPKVIVQLGDAYDMFSAAKFSRSHNVCTPKEEIEEARVFLETFWSNVKKNAPNGAECYQLIGNHDVRPRKRILEQAPWAETFLKWEDFFKFRGVETIFDEREDLELDGIIYEHGYYSRPGQHMRENMKPTVFGHLHRAHLVFEKIRKTLLWELNVGYAADPSAVPLSYPRKKWVRWTPGFGIIDDLGPRFCPISSS